MIGWWLIGCPRPPAPLPVAEPVAGPASPSARAAVDGPRFWTEDGGLCLQVPDGWSGTSGPAPLVLELVQRGTGFRFEVRALDDAVPPPSQRAGFVLQFEDDGSYRTVPVLARAASRAWTSVDPGGPMAFAWYGPLDGRTVEVTVILPAGRATEGLAAVEPLLTGLCRETL